MAGGRLTYQDREHVAAGLAEGLTYAEIGRRLARPTSTISREVTRNGGPGGYRVDHAHQATQGRARRPKAATTAKGATAARGHDSEAVHALEEGLTALMIRSGLPRMAARVLACLCTADAGGLTAAQLVRRLQVSPASISKAIRDLQGHELISRERDARHRRDRYVIDDDVWYRASLASARMNAALADAAQQGAAILGATTPAGARLETTSKFLRHVGHAMAQAVEHWRQMSPRTER